MAFDSVLAVPPSLQTGDGAFRLWHTAQPWGLLATVKGRFTAECVHLLNQGFAQAVQARPQARVDIVHDWREAIAYESSARTLMVEAARAQRDALGTVYVLLGDEVPPLVMMGIELALIAVRPIGVDVRLVRAVDELPNVLPVSQRLDASAAA